MSDGLPVKFELSPLARELLDVLREFGHVPVDHLANKRDAAAVVRAISELRRLGLVTLERTPRGESVARITEQGRAA